jgi:hypothetical protein
MTLPSLRPWQLSTAVLAVVLSISVLAQNARPPQNPQSPQNPQQPAPPATASVSGVVVEMGTNQPIPSASVELRRIDCNNFANPPEVLTATTNPDGRFTFQNIHAGNWCVVATKAGVQYTPAEYLQRGALGRGVSLPITDGQRVAGIQLAMAPTGGISGRIRDANGEPKAFARVQVMETFYQDGQKRLYILQVAQTNDLGEYRFFGLPPARYFVAAVPEDTRRRQVVSVQPPPGAGGHREDTAPAVVTPRILPNGDVIEEVYLTVYYPAETDPQRAFPIDVQSGVTTSGIDFSLGPGRVRSFHLRGRAINGVNGLPATGVQVRIAPRDWTATVVMPSATTDSAGNFDIAGITPGSHVLYASMTMANPNAPATPQPNAAVAPATRGAPTGAQGAPATPAAPPIQLSARVPFDLSGANIENAAIVLLAGASINGKVIQEGVVGDVPRGVAVSLAREPDLVGVPAPNGRVTVQPDGTFTLQSVGAGDYHVYVSPLLNPFQWGAAAVPQQLQNTYVKSIRVGGIDVLNDGLPVPASGSPGNLEIVLGNGGRLDGQASNENHAPMSNVTVVLVPDPALRRRTDLYRTVNTDISGRFRMQGVPPGNYKAFAWEQVDRDIWQNPEFMTSVEGRGMAVNIREGSELTVDLTTISAGH